MLSNELLNYSNLTSFLIENILRSGGNKPKNYLVRYKKNNWNIFRPMARIFNAFDRSEK